MQTVDLQLNTRGTSQLEQRQNAPRKRTEYSLQIAAGSQGVSLESGIQTSASETSACVA